MPQGWSGCPIAGQGCAKSCDSSPQRGIAEALGTCGWLSHSPVDQHPEDVIRRGLAGKSRGRRAIRSNRDQDIVGCQRDDRHADCQWTLGIVRQNQPSHTQCGRMITASQESLRDVREIGLEVLLEYLSAPHAVPLKCRVGVDRHPAGDR